MKNGIRKLFSGQPRTSVRGNRLSIVALEDRITPTDFRDVSGLRFFLPGATDGFTNTANTSSTNAFVQVGLTPGFGETFTRLLDLPGGVVLSSSPNSATINSTLSVRGLTFTGNNLAFAFGPPNNKFSIVGDAAFTTGGVTIGASFGSALGTPGLVIQSGQIASVDLVVTTSFSFGQVNFNSQDLRLKLDTTTATSTRYAVTGSATAKVVGDSTFTSQFGASAAKPGLVIVDGALTELKTDVTSGFTANGVNLAPTDMTLAFDATTKNYGLFGTADASVQNPGVLASFPLNLGDVTNPGLSIVNGAMGSFGTIPLAGPLSVIQATGKVQPTGTVLPILSASALQGSFDNLPQGALVTPVVGTQAFRVSYANNNVTLTAAPTGPFVVDNSGDVDDGNFAASQLTLREAINLANATPGADAITFAAGLGDVVLTSAELLLADTSGKSTITGPTTGTQVIRRSSDVGTPEFRIFNISGGAAATLESLSIANGRAAGDGGGVLVEGGTLVLRNSVVRDNSSGGSGGGIASLFGATLDIANSSIVNNTAGAAGTTSGGGGIVNFQSIANLTNTTISGNSARHGGGGMFNFVGSTLNLTNVTVVGNVADFDNTLGASAGGFGNDGTSIIRNTIIAGNFVGTGAGVTANDVELQSVGAGSTFNLLGFGKSSLTNGVNGNQIGVADAKLAPLANNGGTTQRTPCSRAARPSTKVTKRWPGCRRRISGDSPASWGRTWTSARSRHSRRPLFSGPGNSRRGRTLDRERSRSSTRMARPDSRLPRSWVSRAGFAPPRPISPATGSPISSSARGRVARPRSASSTASRKRTCSRSIRSKRPLRAGFSSPPATSPATATPELVITPDEGGGPRVRVFNGKGFAQVADFFGIDDPNFRGGAAPPSAT